MNITDRMTKLVLARKPEVGRRGVKRAISNACGISYEAVRQWFAGHTGSIKNENLLAVADEFDTTVDWLLAGQGEPPKKEETAAVSGTAQAAQSRAVSLAALATPRSQEILARIARAAEEGRLTEEDLDLLDRIAARFEGAEPASPRERNQGSHHRLREKLKSNDRDPQE